VVHVASSQRSREDKIKTERVDTIDCIEFLYPTFIIFVVLVNRDVLVF
jgi:hypothetical protein